MDRKTAAQKLIDIANTIDKQAAEETFFVCHSCNHTASLASINGKRTKVASESGVTEVEAVAVNDVIACPACDGDMRYVPTEISERYYVEAADDEDPLAEEPKSEDAPPPPPAEEPAPEEVPPKAPEAEVPVEVEEDEEVDLSEDEGEEDTDLEEPAEEPASDDEPVSEPESEPKKAPKKKKDKPDDGKPHLPKDRVPKFEFPKKANDAAFMALVGKYL